MTFNISITSPDANTSHDLFDAAVGQALDFLNGHYQQGYEVRVTVNVDGVVEAGDFLNLLLRHNPNGHVAEDL